MPISIIAALWINVQLEHWMIPIMFHPQSTAINDQILLEKVDGQMHYQLLLRMLNIMRISTGKYPTNPIYQNNSQIIYNSHHHEQCSHQVKATNCVIAQLSNIDPKGKRIVILPFLKLLNIQHHRLIHLLLCTNLPIRMKLNPIQSDFPINCSTPF